MRRLGEMAQLLNQRGLRVVQPNQAVCHVRLQGFNAQQLIRNRLHRPRSTGQPRAALRFTSSSLKTLETALSPQTTTRSGIADAAVSHLQ